jgi:HSP20 family protein
MDINYSQIPINLTEARDDLVLHAPMPGAEPEDILITIDEKTITLHASPRGMLAEDKTMLRHEWRIGDYHRTIELSYPIDSARVNATYRNGVLTVTMPKSDSTTPREIRLGKLQSAYGETQGHSGQA